MSNTKQYPFGFKSDTKRLHGQHEVTKAAMGGRLVLAPIDLDDAELRVLDLGTSDGYWLRDFQRDHPACQALVGADIDASRFPQDLPDNITLCQQDILRPWPQEWLGSFDLVHLRFVLVGSKGEPQPVVNRILELVKPGGWIQLIEADQEIGETDGPAMQQFMAVMTAMVHTMGVPSKFTRGIASWLRAAGFEKVEEAVIPYKIGAKCTDLSMRDTSVVSFSAAVSGLAQFGKMLSNIPGCPKEDLDTLASRCEQEMKAQSGFYPVRCVWGQKPL